MKEDFYVIEFEYTTPGLTSAVQMVNNTDSATIPLFGNFTGDVLQPVVIVPLFEEVGTHEETEYDEEKLRALYQEFGDEDRKLALEGIKEYQEMLEAEDR
jgi:hypothetical protein